MARLVTCNACGGFLKDSDGVCPHCQAQQSSGARRLVGGLMAVGAGSLISVTLMACYGGPVDDDDCLNRSDAGVCLDTDAGNTTTDAGH